MECSTIKSIEVAGGLGPKFGEATCLANAYQPLCQSEEVVMRSGLFVLLPMIGAAVHAALTCNSLTAGQVHAAVCARQHVLR